MNCRNWKKLAVGSGEKVEYKKNWFLAVAHVVVWRLRELKRRNTFGGGEMMIME